MDSNLGTLAVDDSQPGVFSTLNNVVDNLASGMLKYSVAGEAPVEINSKNLKLAAKVEVILIISNIEHFLYLTII